MYTDAMRKQSAELATLLRNLGIPAKEIKVMGPFIIVTCWSDDAAQRFALAITSFARETTVIKALGDRADYKRGDPLSKKYHDVWRVHATI